MDNNRSYANAVLILRQDNVNFYSPTDLWYSGIKDPPIYWQEDGKDKLHGPFITLTTATLHCDAFKAAINSQIPTNVIFVNFKTKKRVA